MCIEPNESRLANSRWILVDHCWGRLRGGSLLSTGGGSWKLEKMTFGVDSGMAPLQRLLV